MTETEKGTQCHRLQSVEETHEITQEANGEVNTNSSNNQRGTENNRVNIAQVPEERNENSQIYSTINL